MHKITINTIPVEVEDGVTILEAASKIGIEIPSLCYLKGINEIASCRVCVVEIEGQPGLKPACVTKVQDGMNILTNTKKVRTARKKILQSLLEKHNNNCNACIRNLNCELQNMADNLCVRDIAQKEPPHYPIDDGNCFITRDYNKCIACHRCEAICRDVQGINVYQTVKKDGRIFIAPENFSDLADTKCIACGQCVLACPTASLSEKEDIGAVWKLLEDHDRTIIVQTAPSIQVTLGEYFGGETGEIVTGKMVAALKGIGFDKVFPTDLTADLTIIEEATELLDRLSKNKRLPMLSSCCPGWVRYVETAHPELIPNLSTCKSPHSMFTALMHSYYAEQEGLENYACVAVMPCTAKKYEARREELEQGGKNMDYVLTTREVGRMIRSAGIRFDDLPDMPFDKPFDLFSGAGSIFGTTGGVLEAAVRSAYAMVNGDDAELGLLEFTEIDGRDGLKEATVELDGRTIRVAVAHGIRNAECLIDRIKKGEHYDFAEIMACPGGCVGGGGQPIMGVRDHKRISLDYRHNRADALFTMDGSSHLRQSHKNPRLIKLYMDFLGHPYSEKAREILHTTYHERK